MSVSTELAPIYLDLVKRVLLRSGFGHGGMGVDVRATNWKRHLLIPLQRVLRARGYRVVTDQSRPSDDAETMIGRQRLDNIQWCVESVISEAVLGDLIETGVWRGGATIFMRAILAAHGISDRVVWVADSFQGFPTVERRSRAIDRGVDFTGGLGDTALSVDLETVKRNFERYGLLDSQVRFLVGWFADTLPTAPIEQLAVLRLDGDLYESTWDALSVLYPKVSAGGYVIVDDYGTFEGCRSAVDDYRRQMRISDPIQEIDDDSVFWRRWE